MLSDELATSSSAQVARHRGSAPNDLHLLDGSYHVGRSAPGMFPADELHCDCPKAPCGLAAPTAAIACPIHLGNLPIRQAHTALSCPGHTRAWWHGLMKRKRLSWNKHLAPAPVIRSAGLAPSATTSTRRKTTPGPTKKTSPPQRTPTSSEANAAPAPAQSRKAARKNRTGEVRD